jgi:hypothetical protein
MKIYFENVKYHSFNNKVVVCTMTARIGELKRNVRAVAKCAPEDVFDYKKGCRIAESKATIKALNQLTSDINNINKWFNNSIITNNNALDRINGLLNREKKHLDILSND